MYETIRYEIANNVACITINRPHRGNSLSFLAMDEIQTAIDQAMGDGARALVLTGEGRFFCTGADLIDNNPEENDASDVAKYRWRPLLDKMRAMPVPTIAAVQGPAFGAGCTMAITCDFTIMARSAFMEFTFVKLGYMPGIGVNWKLAHLVGRQRALEMLMFAERVSAAQAQEIGMVLRAVDDDQCLGEARALAERLAAGPTLAYRELKNIMRAIDDGCTLAESYEVEDAGFALTERSDDVAEGLAAFKSKRPPVFTGK